MRKTIRNVTIVVTALFASAATGRSKAILGSAHYARSHPSRGGQGRDYGADWIAHFSPHLFNTLEGKPNAHQGDARIASSCFPSGDTGYLYASSDALKTKSSKKVVRLLRASVVQAGLVIPCCAFLCLQQIAGNACKCWSLLNPAYRILREVVPFCVCAVLVHWL